MIWKDNQTLNNGGSNSCLQYWHTTWHDGIGNKLEEKTNWLHLKLTRKQKIDICEKMPATILAVQACQISIRYSKEGTDWPWNGLEIASARMCEFKSKTLFNIFSAKCQVVQVEKERRKTIKTIGFSRCLTLTWPWWEQEVPSEQ